MKYIITIANAQTGQVFYQETTLDTDSTQSFPMRTADERRIEARENLIEQVGDAVNEFDFITGAQA